MLLPLLACSHGRSGGSLESLKTAGDAFLQRVRWRDFRGASELVIPERRDRFDKAIAAMGDENDLTITDYQLEDVRLSATDPARGTLIARIRWVQMPSVSEQNALVTSEFVYQGGVWFLGRQDKGPFAEALGERLPDPPR